MKNKLKKSMYAVFIALFVVAFLAWKNMDSQLSAYKCNPDPVIVQDGDSMFGIVVANCTGNVQNAVDDLVEKYGFTEIYPGQMLWLSSKP